MTDLEKEAMEARFTARLESLRDDLRNALQELEEERHRNGRLKIHAELRHKAEERVKVLEEALGSLMDEVADMPADPSECYESWAACTAALTPKPPEGSETP